MNKLSHFALLYLIIGLTFANAEFNLFSVFGFGRSSSHARTSICSNTSIAQTYVAQTLALINKLQGNSTYNSTLQLESANFVSYLQNTTNQALLPTNCTTFFTNLKAAKLADEAAEQTRERINSEIERQFEQASRNATGGKEFYELEEH